MPEYDERGGESHSDGDGDVAAPKNHSHFINSGGPIRPAELRSELGGWRVAELEMANSAIRIWLFGQTKSGVGGS